MNKDMFVPPVCGSVFRPRLLGTKLVLLVRLAQVANALF